MACDKQRAAARSGRLMAGLVLTLLSGIPSHAWAAGDEARASQLPPRSPEQQLRLLHEQIKQRNEAKAQRKAAPGGRVVVPAGQGAVRGNAGAQRAAGVALPEGDKTRAGALSKRRKEQQLRLHDQISLRKDAEAKRKAAFGGRVVVPAGQGAVRANAGAPSGPKAWRSSAQQALRPQRQPVVPGQPGFRAAARPKASRLSALGAAEALLMYTVLHDNLSPVADIDTAFGRLSALLREPSAAARAPFASVWEQITGLQPMEIMRSGGRGTGSNAEENLEFIRAEAHVRELGSVLVTMTSSSPKACLSYSDMLQAGDIAALVVRTASPQGGLPTYSVAVPTAGGGYALQLPVRTGAGHAGLDQMAAKALVGQCVDSVLYKAGPPRAPLQVRRASGRGRLTEAAGIAAASNARPSQPIASQVGRPSNRAGIGGGSGRGAQGPRQLEMAHGASMDGSGAAATALVPPPGFALSARTAVQSVLAIAAQQRLLQYAGIRDAQMACHYDQNKLQDPGLTVAELWGRVGLDAPVEVEFRAPGSDAESLLVPDPEGEIELARQAAAVAAPSGNATPTPSSDDDAAAPGGAVIAIAHGSATPYAGLPFERAIAAVVVEATGCDGGDAHAHAHAHARCYAVAMPTSDGRFVLTQPSQSPEAGLDGLDETTVESLGDARVAMVVYRPPADFAAR